ncbi:hypothetical protein LOK49_LG10G01817 [Camellia lanceoleosa]|uniref:Uncharacterized protein n=1 Tax=Camellia lanceoleosa TaxID=1840588 RepID=A0ACC0GA82_9ERIC|nr:hypothetical protein LOK49_LG10G01817 [Camellia lanceoleosa]
MDESGRIDLGPRGLNLVDVSSENDTLIDLQSTENQNNNVSPGLLEAVNVEKTVDTTDVSGDMELLPQSYEPLEPERMGKIGKCNLRKSLAWDTAFFTSAGVLDHDELSSMIKGVGKGGKYFLPGIEEDIHRSTDSISTLESGSLTLESLEGDLFEDVRASIQKSSKASNVRSSSKVTSALKVDLASKNMLKSKPPSKKQTIGVHGPGKLTKQGSGSSQGTQPMTRNGGLTSSLPKASKVIARPNTIPSVPLKRASLGAKQVEMENDKAKNASVPRKATPVSKIHSLGGSSRTEPKPALSSKPSSATKKPPRSASSCDSSRSASSSNVGISPVKSNRRTASRTVNPTSSSAILKVPSKVVLKKKGQSGRLAHLMSSKPSSNSSPASSISEWSSKSSSSTYTVNQRSTTSMASIDTSSPHRSIDSDILPALDHHNQSNDQISDIHENKVKRLASENLQISTLPRPAKVQPSGLRMPSPKIGFFDGVKPVVRTPTGSMQSYSGVSVGPKIGAGINRPSGGSSKTKLAKLQPARTVSTAANMKLDGQKPVSPLPSQKPSNASMKVSSVSGGLKKCLSISPQAHNETDNAPDSGLDAEKAGSLGMLDREMNLAKQGNFNKKDIEIAPIDRDTHCNAENIKPSEELGEDAISSLKHLKTKLRVVCKSNEKENAHFEDQVDGLTKNEVIGNSITQIDFSHSDFHAPELSCSKEFFVLSQKEGSPSDMSRPTSISPCLVTSEITASTRTPFAVKNSLCNSEGDFSTGLSIGAVEKISSLSSLKSAQTENS